jgi:predicted secreted protein
MMTIAMGIAVFFTIWWTVLFAILPLQVRSQHEVGDVTPGTDPGAPIAPHLAWKALVTTVVSALLFGALIVCMAYL